MLLPITNVCLQVSSVKGESTEEKVLGLAQDVKEHLPELIDYENTLRYVLSFILLRGPLF